MKLSSARVIAPYSGIHEDGANVSKLKHFFRCLETSGTVITDSKGGIEWDVSAGSHSLVFNAAERSILPTLTSSTDPIDVTGQWATFDSTKVQLVMCVGYVDSTYSTHVRTAIGDTNGIIYASRQGIGLAGQPLHTSFFNGVNNLGQIRVVTPLTNHPAVPPGDIEPETFDTATLNGQSVIQAALAINDETQHYYVVRGVSDWVIKTGPSSRTLLTNYSVSTDELDPAYTGGYSWASTGGLTPAPCMRFSGMRLQGYAIFEFDSIPSDIDTAMKWMAASWAHNERYIYPAWID